MPQLGGFSIFREIKKHLRSRGFGSREGEHYWSNYLVLGFSRDGAPSRLLMSRILIFEAGYIKEWCSLYLYQDFKCQNQAFSQ